MPKLHHTSFSFTHFNLLYSSFLSMFCQITY